MVPSNLGSENHVFDKYTFPETIGKTSKTMGAHPGTKTTSLIKIPLTKNNGKSNKINDFQQSWELPCHGDPGQTVNWNGMKWIRAK